jgi:hypothetical protein
VATLVLSWQVRLQLRLHTSTSAEMIGKGCTDLWRLYHVWRGNSHLVVEELHKKYGPVVRIGPNVLDLDYPERTKKIYNIKGDWLKVYSNDRFATGGIANCCMLSDAVLPRKQRYGTES